MSNYRYFTKDRDWLYENYVIKGLTREQCAKEGNTTLANIKEYLRKWNIEKSKLIIKKEDLINYVNNGLTTKEISEIYKCHKGTINRYFKKYNIKNTNYEVYEQYDDTNDQEIIKLYNDGKSTVEISKIFNCSATSIRSHLKHNGIKMRTFAESMWNYHKKEIPEDFNDYKKLYNLYIEESISKAELARRYNCTIAVINRVLNNLNITNIPYTTDTTRLGNKIRTYFNRLVPNVIERDHNTCQLCGCHENLQVHHIVPFKILFHNLLSEHPELNPTDNFDELFNLAIKNKELNNIDNLITYCKNCHMYKIHNFGNN